MRGQPRPIGPARLRLSCATLEHNRPGLDGRSRLTARPSPDGDGRAVSVLLVEDDEDDYVLTRELLGEIRTPHFKIDWVRDFDQAIQSLDDCAHDVVLVDYRLGNRDGVELVAEAVSRKCDLPIIVLTGQGDRETDVAAMEAGAADFLSKRTITADGLERSIRYAMQQKRAERGRAQVAEAQMAEREADARRAAAEAATAAKDQFLAVVSHELRTPLNAILGWAEVLRSEVGQADVADIDLTTLREGIATIERNGRSQQVLIEDLLDVSRIIAGKIRLNFRECHLRDVMASAVESVEMGARRRKIKIVQCVGCDLPPMTADPDRLRQVCWNLLSNAVKFTDDGGWVDVTLDRDGDAAVLAVQDDGAGIDAADLEGVFGRFQQVDGQSRPGSAEGATPSGLGLGLAIVRHLVDLHGGTVSVHSDGEGRGSTFTVRLPLGCHDGADLPSA